MPLATYVAGVDTEGTFREELGQLSAMKVIPPLTKPAME